MSGYGKSNPDLTTQRKATTKLRNGQLCLWLTLIIISRLLVEWNGTSLARYCRRQATMVVFVCGKLLLEMYGGLLGVLGLNKRRENPIRRRKIRMSIWILDLLYLYTNVCKTCKAPYVGCCRSDLPAEIGCKAWGLEVLLNPPSSESSLWSRLSDFALVLALKCFKRNPSVKF